MPSPSKCKKSYKELGYKNVKDCIAYGNTDKSKSGAERSIKANIKLKGKEKISDKKISKKIKGY